MTRSYYNKGGPRKGWCHFMEMRLGKTPTALNEYLLLRKYQNVQRALIVAPNKYKGTWKTEAERFGVDVPIHVYEASGTKEYARFLRQLGKGGAGILCINYEALIRSTHFDNVQKFLKGDHFLVADESVMFKSPKSQVNKAMQRLGKEATYARCLSGMPAPYAPYDLWTQLRFIGSMAWPNFYPFKMMFTKMGGWMGKQAQGIQNEKELNKLLDKVSFRARKVDWGIAEGVDYEEVPLEMTPEQVTTYQQMEKDFVAWLGANDMVTADNVLTKHIKLQEIASGFLYDEFGKVKTIVPLEQTPKFIDLAERLDMYIPGKVIVVAHYKPTIQALLKALARFNPRYIMGNMSSAQVTQAKRVFNEDPDCKVLVGQSQALKYGHTLVGSDDMPCYSMCFFENSYSLDTRAQCEARSQGMHQKAPIHIWDYYSCKVERDIIRALQKRKRVSTVIMSHYKNAR